MILMLAVTMALLYQQVSRNGQLQSENEQLEQSVIDMVAEQSKHKAKQAVTNKMLAQTRIENQTLQRNSDDLRRQLQKASVCAGSDFDDSAANWVRNYRGEDRGGARASP